MACVCALTEKTSTRKVTSAVQNRCVQYGACDHVEYQSKVRIFVLVLHYWIGNGKLVRKNA